MPRFNHRPLRSNQLNNCHFGARPLTCAFWLQLVAVLGAMVMAINASSIGAAETAGASSTSTTIISNMAAAENDNIFMADHLNVESEIKGNHSQQQRRRSGYAGFSPLDKEVVERLIKQWAPIVWLAPEEKFMPLGVDEFLNHVHPMDKGKTFIPGMPIGDKSEKAYLVTNAEIDELLENEKSFLYGRNPNESPVPIYAVVSLCSQPPLPLSTTAPVPPNRPPPEPPLLVKQPLPAPPSLPSSTRGPYIPVSINPLEAQTNTIRRSSRLYTVFKRVQRDVAAFAPPQQPPSQPLLMNHLNPNALTDNYNLMQGETKSQLNVNTEPSTSTTEHSDNSQVNNFIANLADNVRFSGMNNELDNNIDIDNNFDMLSKPPKVASNTPQQNVPGFHVTYWMFYPYSQGKTMCTLSLGPLGSIPFPAVYGFCLGRRKDIGSHIGDWEHMSLYFNGAAEPEAMYVSAHDAGAYYSYNRLTGSFEFKKQETRKGILQRPNFPKTVTTFNSHPVLFAAKGSHGLWTAPGKHRFVKVARLYDVNGFGTPWNTWKAVDITYENLKSYGRSLIPSWLSFKGKWGNPKSKCHPFRRIGLNFCEYTDGPTGIPLKEPHFQCGTTTHL